MQNLQNYYYNSCNYQEWFHDLKLVPGKDFLWLMHHQKRTDLQELLNLPAYQNAKNIFLIDSESVYCNHTAEWINDKRIHFFMPCVSKIDRCYTYHFWFSFMTEIELHLKYNSKLIESYNKKYMFDALLGTHRWHKNVVKQFIDNSSYGDQFFLSYTGNPQNNNDCNWINGSESETEQSGTIIYSQSGLQTASSSLIIPYKIYNQCHYSLVCETTDKLLFYTEKTGKPLLSKRIFVMFAGKHHLKHLREFGFKTFDGIIDEGYDNISDTETRYAQAWKQVEFLAKQDPSEIYKLAQPILEYNYNHFMQTNWKNQMHKTIQNISHSSK